MTTSSLHALSNTLCRAEKPSPHSSPRQNRKVLNSAAANSPQQHNAVSSAPAGHSSPVHTANNATVAGTSFDIYSSCSSSSSGSNIGANVKGVRGRPIAISPPPLPIHSVSNRMSAPVSSVAVAKALTRMPSTDSCAGTSSITSPVSQSMHMLHSLDNGDVAPPLPPRKVMATPKQEPTNTPQRNPRPSAGRPSAAESPSVVESRSVEEVVVVPCSEFEVPRTIAPPVPRHQTPPASSLATDLQRACRVTSTEQPQQTESPTEKVEELTADEIVIVGPAETISGLIDTRPLEARKPIIIRNPMPSPVEAAHKEAVLIDRCANGGNNLYQLKTAASPLAQSRQRSVAAQSPAQSVPKSVTSSQTTSPSSEAAGSSGIEQTVPMLYENVSLNNKQCNVSYENINLEYIARLVSQGYSKENAIMALGISRNNIEMACDILHWKGNSN